VYRGPKRSPTLACFYRRCRTRPPPANSGSTSVLAQRTYPIKSFDSSRSNSTGTTPSLSFEDEYTCIQFRGLQRPVSPQESYLQMRCRFILLHKSNNNDGQCVVCCTNEAAIRNGTENMQQKITLRPHGEERSSGCVVQPSVRLFVTSTGRVASHERAIRRTCASQRGDSTVVAGEMSKLEDCRTIVRTTTNSVMYATGTTNHQIRCHI
jgi:hypothetical protein